MGEWEFEAEIDHLGDYWQYPCELGSSGHDEKWLDSILKVKPTWMRHKREKRKRERGSKCNTRFLARVTGRLQLLFIKMGKIVGEEQVCGWNGGEINQEYGLEHVKKYI